MAQQATRSSDAELLASLQSKFSKVSSGGQQWRETYMTGNTIKHIVAVNSKPRSTA